MTSTPEIIHQAGDVAILEWRDPLGLRGRGFFTVRGACIAFQRGYWDKLSFSQVDCLTRQALYRLLGRGACIERRVMPLASAIARRISRHPSAKDSLYDVLLMLT